MKENVLPDRDFFIEALREEAETGGEGPAIRETCEALSTALHAIPFFFFRHLFFPQPSLTRSLRPFYVPTSCSTYLLQSGTSCRRVDARIIWGTELSCYRTELNHSSTLLLSATGYWLLTVRCGQAYITSSPSPLQYTFSDSISAGPRT